jgi:bisphosphoglycerate-independent phosphoglycerate mutase (AlkP superfamily)
MKNGRAVFMDFTNELLIARGEDVLVRTPEEAAAALANVVRENRFTLYEYFITDKMGHAQDWEGARSVILKLAALVRSLLGKLDLDQTTVILTSDHGNIEDLSTRNHTLNAVPTIVWGAHRDRVANRIQSLADITPAILAVLTERGT